MKPAKTKEKFIELRAEGLSYAAISKSIDVGKSTLVGWGREMELDIRECKDERLNEVRVKYKLHREAQMQRYGKWLKKIETELSKRDFSYLKTDRLVQLAIQLTGEVRVFDPREKEEADRDKNVVTIEELEQMNREVFTASI
ncbi:hypothetical protein HQ524_03625 [Candidatus Uhrbacteria bacterium]|nr:hypothetical protein [Candidatus Uhrbacteria bacterium]